MLLDTTISALRKDLPVTLFETGVWGVGGQQQGHMGKGADRGHRQAVGARRGVQGCRGGLEWQGRSGGWGLDGNTGRWGGQVSRVARSCKQVQGACTLGLRM